MGGSRLLVPPPASRVASASRERQREHFTLGELLEPMLLESKPPGGFLVFCTPIVLEHPQIGGDVTSVAEGLGALSVRGRTGQITFEQVATACGLLLEKIVNCWRRSWHYLLGGRPTTGWPSRGSRLSLTGEVCYSWFQLRCGFGGVPDVPAAAGAANWASTTRFVTADSNPRRINKK